MRGCRPLVRASLGALLTLGLHPVMASAQPGSPSGHESIAAVAHVEILGGSFMPRNVAIPVGGKVIWKNVGGLGDHTTTSDTGEWDSGVLQPGDTFAHTFDTAGIFSYHCTIHPTMTGRVTVTGT